MVYRIRTNKKAGIVRITVNNDTNLEVKGIDPLTNNRVFFKREIRSRGTETYSFGVPLASKYIDVIIKQSIPSKEYGFKAKITYDKLIKPPFFTDALTAKYIEFVNNFAFNVCKYPPGMYTDKEGLFKVSIVPELEDTPMRINVITNLIEVSKKHMDDDTVPGIAWLFFHEYGHNFQSADPDCEKEADFHAEDIYLSLGYPGIESFKMIASFHETEQNRERLEQTEGLLDNYEEKIYFNKQ